MGGLLVGRVGINHQLDGQIRMGVLHRDEQLMGAFHRAAVVILAVEDEQGLVDLLRVGHGGGLQLGQHEFLKGVKLTAAALHVRGGVADQIAGHAALGDVALEAAFLVGGDVVGHVAAVAAAGHAQAIEVDPGAAADGLVHEGQQILIGAAIVGSLDVLMLWAIAAGAPRVAVNDCKAFGGQTLVFHGQAVGVEGMGAAVDIQNSGVLFVGVEVNGRLYPAVDDALAIRRGDGEVRSGGEDDLIQHVLGALDDGAGNGIRGGVQQVVGFRHVRAGHGQQHFALLDAAQAVTNLLTVQHGDGVAVIALQGELVHIAPAIEAADEVHELPVRGKLNLVHAPAAGGIVGELHALVAVVALFEDELRISAVHREAEEHDVRVAQGGIRIGIQRAHDDGGAIRGDHRADGVGVGHDPQPLGDLILVALQVHGEQVISDGLLPGAVLVAAVDHVLAVGHPGVMELIPHTMG